MGVLYQSDCVTALLTVRCNFSMYCYSRKHTSFALVHHNKTLKPLFFWTQFYKTTRTIGIWIPVSHLITRCQIKFDLDTGLKSCVCIKCETCICTFFPLRIIKYFVHKSWKLLKYLIYSPILHFSFKWLILKQMTKANGSNL